MRQTGGRGDLWPPKMLISPDSFEARRKSYRSPNRWAKVSLHDGMGGWFYTGAKVLGAKLWHNADKWRFRGEIVI